MPAQLGQTQWALQVEDFSLNSLQVDLSLALIEIEVLLQKIELISQEKCATKAIFCPLFLKFPLLFISLAAAIMNVTEVEMGEVNKWNVTENADFL